MIDEAQLQHLNSGELRGVVRGLQKDVGRQGREINHKQALIDKLTHEVAVLKRLKFAAQSERLHGAFNAEQSSLIEETIDADLAALALRSSKRLPPQAPTWTRRSSPSAPAAAR